MKKLTFLLLIVFVLAFLTGCDASSASQDGRLSVVATTSIVADVVEQVGGDAVKVQTLLPLGSDPHAYQPAPRDMAAVADASLIFANGAGLEAFLQPLIDSAGATAKVVEVSDGITLLEGSQEGSDAADSHTSDPHTYTDPNNVLVWVENIRAALTELQPDKAAAFQANADRYSAELRDLDTWIRAQVETIPAENRVLVTDHLVYGYFAGRYGFTQVGAVIPGFSTDAAPSAQELAQIEEQIRSYNAKAIFIGEGAVPAVVKQVVEDTQVQLVKLYHASLSSPSGDAPTYIKMMHYNVNAITAALK